METNRGAPDSTPSVEKPTVSPAEVAAAPASSLATSQDKPVESGPKTIAAIQARTAAALAKAEPKPEPVVTPEPDPAAEPPAETAPPAEIPAETPAETTDEAEPAAEAPAEGDEPEADPPLAPFEGKRKHLRVPDQDKIGRMAITILARNRDMTMEDAVIAAKKHYGIALPGATTEPAKIADPDKPETIAAATARIAELRAERKKANTELRTEDSGDISDKIEELMLHRLNLERKEEHQQQEEQSAATTAYSQAFDAAEAKALELYPFAGDPDSPEAKRMLEIEESLKANGDPLYESPEKPLRVAQMVARERNIAPKSKSAPAAPAKPAAPAPGASTVKKQMLPGGGSRTTPPVTPTLSPIDAKIQASRPKSMQELRLLEKSIGLR